MSPLFKNGKSVVRRCHKFYGKRFAFFKSQRPFSIEHMSPLLPRIFLFQCRAGHVNWAELAAIWTHDRDARVMGISSILRHKLLCIPVFKEILHCKAVCDVKSRVDPCLSHHSLEFKLLLQVLITLRVLPGR